MKIHIKLTGVLYGQIMADLVRPHPFAAERVGFVYGRMGSLNDGKLILLNRYASIPDAHYVDDPMVGARIGPSAMTSAMQEVYRGRGAREGIFHIHLHGHAGETAMSATDAREIPAMIPGFQSVGRDAAHGIIIVSPNHGRGWVWLPASTQGVEAAQISVIGAPVGVFERRSAR
jgi:hypothetical protein